MSALDWNEFKQWKDYQASQKKEKGNLYLLIDFLMKVHHIVSVEEIYQTLQSDSLGESLLDKNSIKNPDDIIKFMKKNA